MKAGYELEEYELYGKTLKVTKVGGDELLIMEDLQYITPLSGGGVYVLQSILPKSKFLIGCEFSSGRTELLRIKEHCFCERPKDSGLLPVGRLI